MPNDKGDGVYTMRWQAQTPMLTPKVIQAMENVRVRQNNTCQWWGCNATTDIIVHHIFPRREYPELASDERYMICYCDKHHVLWHWHYEAIKLS